MAHNKKHDIIEIKQTIKNNQKHNHNKQHKGKKHKMANWKLIKEKYLAGEKPKDIGKAHKLSAQCISDRASQEGWTSERAKKQEEMAQAYSENYKEEINKLFESSLKVLQESLDSNNKDIQLAAVRIITPLTGLNKQTNDTNIDIKNLRKFVWGEDTK